MTRINVKIKAGQETELNGAGPDIPESAMQALEEKLDRLQKGDILILAGSIPASLAQTTYERILARLEGRDIRAVVDATRDLLVNVLRYKPFLIKPNNHERCCWMRPEKYIASAARRARSSTASVRGTAWWPVLWPVISRAAVTTPQPSSSAPPAAVPPRSAWDWRQKRILISCSRRCE